MKKLIYLMVAMALMSCEKEPKNYVTFSGKITGPNSDSIQIKKGDYRKVIHVNDDGTFSDTLKVQPSSYTLYDGGEYAYLFLKNGFDIHMTLDTKAFDETIQFTGEGANHSNFLAEKIRKEMELFDLDGLISLDSVDLDKGLAEVKSEMIAFYDANKDVDSSIINSGPKNIDRTIDSYRRYIHSIYALKREFPKGMEAPKWSDYENINGEKTSLADLKGKYVYVDVWATWCGPCKREIPSLKKVEAEYHEKNIAFVSISVDDNKSSGSWDQARADWRQMVEEEELTGVQLFSPEGRKSPFMSELKVRGIPRFILIDPQGKIVSPSAPRPSSEELIELFDEEQI